MSKKKHLSKKPETLNHQVAQCLAHLVSDTYVLYIKTQNFHWNVVDPRFYSLHKLFEEQYEELAEAVDLIAEQIRFTDHKAPGSMKEFLKLTSLKEADTANITADEMLKQLSKDHQSLVCALQNFIEEGAKWHNDGAVDLLVERQRAHDKMAWMLRSHLSKK